MGEKWSYMRLHYKIAKYINCQKDLPCVSKIRCLVHFFCSDFSDSAFFTLFFSWHNLVTEKMLWNPATDCDVYFGGEGRGSFVWVHSIACGISQYLHTYSQDTSFFQTFGIIPRRQRSHKVCWTISKYSTDVWNGTGSAFPRGSV